MKKYTLFLISLIMCSFVAADAIDEAYIVQEQTEYETLYAQINTLVNGASATEPGGRRIHECYSKFDADTYQLNWDYSDGLGIRNQGVLDCVDKKNADPEIRGVEQIWVSCIHEKANPIDKVYYGTLLKHAKDALACMEGIECKINGLYDGVVADGVSEITFTLEKPGTLELVTVGELKGEITKQTSSLITFKPDEADAEKNYLKPQKVTVKAECDRGGTAEKEFTIEQPPLLLLHGILGSSETWSSFMPWLNSDGFSFKAISYSNTGDIVVNAKSVDSIIEKFIQEIREGDAPKPIVDFDGAYVYIQWENRKIMVSKIDVVSHSMGGVVTRQYITRGDYKDNIRKLVMIAPPHHGAYFLNWVPLLQGPIGGDALAQLRPMSSFQDAINGNNRKILDTDVKPYIIAGNGWATRIRHQSGQIYQKTWRGDGVVAIDSAKLSGIPMYCTWDNHAPEVDWMKIECDIVAENKGGGIMDSPLTFAITKDLLLTGNTAQRTASCEEDFCKPPLPSVTDNYVPPTASNPMRTSYGSASAYIESPVTIHAFDQDGKHIGLNEQGEVENEIGDHAFYFSAQKTGTHPIIKVLNFPGQDIVFKTVGYEEGKYNMVVIIETYDAITEMRFEDVATDENTQHSIDTTLEELDLAEEEKTITVKIPEDYLVDSPESSPEVNDQDQNVEDVPETGDLSRTSDEQEGGFFSWLAKLFKGIFGGSTQSKPEDKSQSTGEKGTKYYLTPENTVSFVSDEYHFTGHKNTEGLLTGEWTPTETYGFLVKTDIPALKNEKNGKLHVKISNYHNKQNKDETCDITKGFTINKLTSDWDADTASFGKIESLQSNSVVIGRFNVDPNVQKPKEYFEIILPVKELVGEYGFTIIQTGDGLCRLEVYSHMSSENNRPYITVE